MVMVVGCVRGLCLWSVFVVVVGCPKLLLWTVVVDCGGGVSFFCWLSLSFLLLDLWVC